jgi:hypothetical protein
MTRRTAFLIPSEIRGGVMSIWEDYTRLTPEQLGIVGDLIKDFSAGNEPAYSLASRDTARVVLARFLEAIVCKTNGDWLTEDGGTESHSSPGPALQS